MINWDDIASDLGKLKAGCITRCIELNQLSRWRIGGVGALSIEPNSAIDISAIVKYCKKNNVPYLTIGDGSNLLFDDAGLNALIIKIGKAMAAIEVIGGRVKCGAGRWVPSLARYSASKGFSGLEHIAGIPGTLGGLICMNGGSQRKGIGDNVVEVESVDFNGDIQITSKDQCGFKYRESVFQKDGAIVTGCVLELDEGSVSLIRKDMLAILKSRREKFPLKLPNCGSVFVSNPSMYEKIGPPGYAIEQVGLKGFSVGGASISELHANFFVNTGGATSKDIISLIKLAREKVVEVTGFEMNSEVRYVSFEGVVMEATRFIDFNNLQKSEEKRVYLV